MKYRILFTIKILLLAFSANSQQNYCADSSYRIKYIFGNLGASLFNTPDTSGTNIFTGESLEGVNYGIAFLKTTWGDSLIVAKKFIISGKDVANRNSFTAPDGTLVCTGIWGGAINNNPEILISRIDTNGNMQWAKRFRYNPIHLYYYPDSRVIKNILIANNSIYFTALFNGYNGIIAKLSLDGNLIWSKYFSMNSVSSGLAIISPVYSNNILYILGASGFSTTSAGSVILTKLNEANGNIVGSFGYTTSPDTLVKGILPTEIKFNSDNSISITGLIAVQFPGYIGPSSIIFNTLLDSNLDPAYNYYFKNNVMLNNLDIYSDFNNQRQHAFLGENTVNRDKFFMTFGKDDRVLRTRKFSIPTTLGTPYRNSVNLDDKQNLHFLYHYTQGGQLITEYARISDFAPSGAPGCFGKDTSILTQYSFTISKQPFTWDNVTSDVLISNPVVFTEDTAIVTKELVCKIVSYCDSIHIKGPASGCVGQTLRYSVAKNNGCFKNMDWLIDTTVANIISTEGDSAITISFKQAFNGYIHSALTDCVIKDSFKVNIMESPLVKILNRDSLLCPGKTIVLNTNAGFNPYLWQDGSNTQNYTVSTIGFYKITATSFCAVQSSDSIVISLADTSLVITPTQTICKYDTAFIILPPDVININWQPNNNISLNNKTLALYPLQNTIYTITAGRLANCPVSRTSEVLVKNCAKYIFVPNAFSPNNDGNNDIFRAIPVRSPESFLLTIYNRYGQKLFETTDPSSGWDGNYSGKPQSAGGYAYHCSYRFAGDLERAESGYFILIR